MRTLASILTESTLLCFLMFILINRAVSGVPPHEAETKHETLQDSAIRKSLLRVNEVLATKDLQTVMSIYDNSDDIIVIGSDSGEVFIGKERVKVFMKMIISMPFVFSFEMDQVLINHDQNIAWAFVDGKMVHTRSSGKVTKIPYRITAVMVKRGNEWKWKVFSGSIPRSE